MSVFVSDPSENIKNSWSAKYGLGLSEWKNRSFAKNIKHMKCTCSNTRGGLLS